MSRVKIKRAKIYLLVCIACLLIFFIWAMISPYYFRKNLKEDRVVEYTTLLCLVALIPTTFCVGLRKKTAALKFYWFLAAFCYFIFAGDEWSWGTRDLDIEPPYPYGIKFDGVHDIFQLYFVPDAGWKFLLATIIALSVFVFILIATKLLTVAIISAALKSTAFRYFVLGIFLTAIAAVFDYFDVPCPGAKKYGRHFPEEILEFFAALCFLFSTLEGMAGVRVKRSSGNI